MVTVLLADGFEEIEALTPVDLLRRADIDVKTVGIGGKVITGSHGIRVECDLTADEVVLGDIDAVVLPGGMPGALNLDASPFVDEVLKEVSARNGVICAICASPLILGRRGLLLGKRATCYPGFENELRGATVVDMPSVTDGRIVTGRSMGASVEFSKALIALLCGKEKSERVASAIIEA